MKHKFKENIEMREKLKENVVEVKRSLKPKYLENGRYILPFLQGQFFY